MLVPTLLVSTTDVVGWPPESFFIWNLIFAITPADAFFSVLKTMPSAVSEDSIEMETSSSFRDFAKKSGIIIIRGTQRRRFNYNEVYKGKNLDQNILLEPGDQIIVP